MVSKSLKPFLLITLSTLYLLGGDVLPAIAQATMDPPHDPQGCTSCHDMAAFDQPSMIPGGSESVFNLVCQSCHNGIIVSPDIATHSSSTTSENYGIWSVGCSVCHNQHTQENPVGGGFIRSTIDLSRITITPSKSGTRPVVFTGTTTLADGDAILNGICEVCHTQTTHFQNDGSGSDQLHSNVGSVAGTDCMKCHGHTGGFKGSGHTNSHFRWDGGCKNCHGAGAGAEGVVSGMHANDCDLCHLTGGPYDADNNKAGARGLGDATLAEGDAGTWMASCITCHNKTDVPGFHGLTLAEVEPIHENLGSSRGSWADSGGTIPSTRAAGYTGKIDTTNALIDDDYNCADCHDTERTGFTPLEALEVHLLESGLGRGNCATCHRASMVSDEITAGIGGTTIECEDCHSLANGNGPSGEKMYQYDGERHHKTINAQTGNCTRCHADPRPADLSAEPGHAGTAAVNDGSDTDGIPWNDGFDDDFGINNLNPRPTQMGCRLCHTNYETYTVNVRAEEETDATWDTSELKDLHGYNKTPPTPGLTVYANDFDARGTTLTYRDRDMSGGAGDKDESYQIRGAKQTTQIPVPGHRIDAVSGNPRIDVQNYGACFSCHTVQVRHGAPVPGQDYDIPVQATDDASRNTHPYDTLRYSPGRSVFNDHQGSTIADTWNDHAKPWGWLMAPNDLCCRGRWVFLGGTSFFDNINNYSPSSLVTVPVNTNVNQLEGFPGTATHTIREFDTGPAVPSTDNITITVAQWTGSAVYVEATSSFGSGQDFSFTYSGAGGPCNTTMTWDTDHYEGTCIDASGWIANDTVTVSNNTTPAPDKDTRTLDDLTLSPVVPVLSGIVLSDNNDSDPALAEAGYSNSLTVRVAHTVSNYPTFLMLAEDSGFTLNSTGWVPYDLYYDYTLTGGDGTRTVYAKVKNGAGESGSQSNTIIIDTISPAIQADTLTAPNGGETWAQATNYDITWTSADISDSNLKANPVQLHYSTDSGATYPNPIAADETNDGSYTWNVNTVQSSTAKMKLTARDKAGNESSDTSDADFTFWPFVVTNTNDSGAGSLRQIITDVEARGDNHKIWFNIPNTDPGFVNGVAVISLLSDLPPITRNAIRIEGDSQRLLQGDTNPNGPEVRIAGPGSGTGITIQGITGFHNLVNNLNFLLDPLASWTPGEFVGKTIYNLTDGSSGNITSNSSNQIDVSLAGGTDNDWDNFDRYTITGTADSIYIDNLQITNFTTGISSTGYDTSMEYNQFGFYSDSTGYGAGANTSNAILSGRYSNVYNQNFFACATTGLNLAESSDAWVYGNTFGMYPDGTACPNTTGINISAAAIDAAVENNVIRSSSTGIYLSNADNASIDKNIISGGTYGIHLGGSSANITITGNQIGVQYSGGSWIDLPDPSSRSIWVQSSGVNNIIGGSPRATSDGVLGKSNVIDPQGYGIYLTDNAEVYGNFIGTNPERDEIFAGSGGIRVESGGSDSIIGSAAEAGNVITNMGFRGVYLGSTWADRVRISRNLIYNNSTSANLSDDGIDGVAGALVPRPTIISANTSTVTVGGIASGETVEVYHSDYDGTGTEYGEGQSFIGSALSSGTSVAVDISAAGLNLGDWVSAIRIQADNDTSPFSSNTACVSPDLTTAGVATAVMASSTSIDISMPYSDDLNNTSTYTIEYKLSSSGTWLDWGINPKAHTASPYTDTITGLTPGETYDVRMTYNDVDGVTGTSQQTVSNILVPQYTTTAGTATAAMASSTSIDISMPYTYDDNSNNTYTVEYKLSSSGTWLDWGTNPKAHTASPYTGTITGLTPGETYDVRMTYNDVDGVSGTNPQTVSSIVLPLSTTTAGAATAAGVCHVSIDVSMPYTDDGNSNNTYTIEYKLSSSGTWLDWGTNPKGHTASPYTDTITGLTPTESYDVRMTYNDVDGVSGSQVQTVTNIVLGTTPTYEVLNTNDSGAGSLRQVLTDMISCDGYATLNFNIPGGLLTNGVAVINTATDLPDIDKDNCIIDGTSQTTNQGNTNSNGPEILLDGPAGSSIGFDITADGAIIQGLQIGGFGTGIQTTGADTQILGNYFGYSVDNTPTFATRQNGTNITLSGADAIVGSSNPADRNYITNSSGSNGVYINTATGTQFINNVIGMRSDYTPAANGARAVYNFNSSTGLFQDNVFIGSVTGLYINGASATDNVIKGNTFGVYYNAGVWTSVAGQTTGIRFSSGDNTIIGGPTLATDDANLNDSNVFDPGSHAIYLFNPADYGTEIYGNFIGTNPEQDETFAGSYGIFAEYPTGVTIGGSDAGESANVIANMGTCGVWLQFSQANYFEFSRNSFYNNGNNSGDDAICLNGGSNNSITRPTIGAASTTTVTVNGVDGGNGGTQAGDIVEVYIADFSGTEYGEGKTFVGSAVVSFGSTTVDVPVSGVSSGQWVTAIRTNHYTTVPSYQTSAFSTNVVVP